MKQKIVFIVVFFSAVVFSNYAKSQVIGTVNASGVPTLTFTPVSEILDSWNGMLADAGITANLNDVRIRKVGGNYFLRATGTSYKSTSMLALGANGNLTLLVNAAGGKTTCTTSFCSQSDGCEVTPSGKCSPCAGDCTKQTTNAAYLFQ